MDRCDSGAVNGGGNDQPRDGGRRDFLKKVGALPAALIAAQVGSEAPAAPTEPPKLPQVRLGRYTLSRLICGSNTFNAGSHLSVFVNHQMREYFTPEQIFKTLRRCEEEGVNCWQSGLGNIELYRQYVDRGLKMHFIAIDAGNASSVEKLAAGGCIAIAHHGERTDAMFKDGQIDRMHDYLKRVRDAGLLVGVSTHMPDVVDAVESKGWDVDYYMTCVYERHRSAAQLEELLGQAPIPVGEVYLPNDPPRMFQAVRRTKRPCLAFKILAAGRLSERRQWVEQAFRQTFESIKPTDAVIVGMYDRYSDQPADNAALVRRFG
ncbi:MAG: twin-arginine translocation signal domain-containing protein [Pirellulales bacterium]|nr:twin-arginine translocation signal domain-containing protein [Pirellulales bacterium]